nr:MAG TPA: hypothetical protein [Caudoviricetes sp.]
MGPAKVPPPLLRRPLIFFPAGGALQPDSESFEWRGAAALSFLFLSGCRYRGMLPLEGLRIWLEVHTNSRKERD